MGCGTSVNEGEVKDPKRNSEESIEPREPVDDKKRFPRETLNPDIIEGGSQNSDV